jgi:P27 family predicted phage terminase small subunit
MQVGGVPECPGWLDEPAKAVWDELAPRLIEAGVLASLDANSLSRYCILWCRWREIEDDMRQHGQTRAPTEGGAMRPQVRIADKLCSQLLRLEQELGLTPSARARIHVPDKGAEAGRSKSVYFEGA